MADKEKMPRPLFGQVAIMAEFSTQQQVDECLKIQNKGRRAGTHFYLGTILINKGYLTVDNAMKILKYQKVQIVQDPSNNNRYNIHSFSAKKKYRSPESTELLVIPKSISSITVRGDMGLKNINHESSNMPVVPGSLFDIENLSYEMELGGTSVDITSLNLAVDPFEPSDNAVSFDDIPAQSDEPVMIDPFNADDFAQDPFAQQVAGFPTDSEIAHTDPFPGSTDPFTAPDDPFASAIDMFGEVTETDDEQTELQSKFPPQMNSSLYVAGSEGVQARQEEDEWGDWGESSESIDNVDDESQKVDRTLDGPVMAELTTEEKASTPLDFDLVDGATMVDPDSGVEMGNQLRDFMQNEKIDLTGQPDATTFEDAATIMDKDDGVSLGENLQDKLSTEKEQIPQVGEKVTKSYDEALAAFDTSSDSPLDTFDRSGFSDNADVQDSDPFEETNIEQPSEPFDSEFSEDVFTSPMLDEAADIGFDAGFEDVFGDSQSWEESEAFTDEGSIDDIDSKISEQWDVPEIKEEDISAQISSGEVAGDIVGAEFWDTHTQDESIEEEEEIVEDFIEMKEVEKITKHIEFESQAEDAKGINTMDLFTPDGELQQTVREELMKGDQADESFDPFTEQPEKLTPVTDEDSAELIEETIEDKAIVGELIGDVATSEGSLSGDVASAEGALEGEILDVTTKAGKAGDVIDIQIKKKRKKDFDFVDGLSLDEITTLEQEKGFDEVFEEQTDVDIMHVKEEQTDLDIKRQSGWRSMFYGRKSGDTKAKVNVVLLFSFLLGLTIIASAMSLLGNFIQRDGQFIDNYIGYFNEDVEIEKTTIDPEIWNELETARKLARNLEFDKSFTMLNKLENKYAEYKAIFQSERDEIFKKQTETEKELIDEFNNAIVRSEDLISIREALSNVTSFIAKYSEKPYINIMKADDYVKNAQDEIKIIEKELLDAEIPKESKLINMLRVIAAWNPADLLDNKEVYEKEIDLHTTSVKEIKNALKYWKDKEPEVHKRVNTRSKLIFDFFDKELRLCDLLINEAENEDIDINSIWEAIDAVKEIEKSLRGFEEFDSVLKTDWILLKKQEINDEYTDKVYSNLVKLYEQANKISETSPSEIKTKIEFLSNLNEKIEGAKGHNLSEKIKTTINEMQTEIEILLTDLRRKGNYTEWRNMAIVYMAEKKYKEAHEYFEKIYPFDDDENPDEIKFA
ncbi:MAG: tetratricopeptide repeat protein [Planctomycetes bacterium]|nr:tetratricopeptide repeat protein [Planctomycetota bacterium]